MEIVSTEYPKLKELLVEYQTLLREKRDVQQALGKINIRLVEIKEKVNLLVDDSRAFVPLDDGTIVLLDGGEDVVLIEFLDPIKPVEKMEPLHIAF